MEFGYSQLFDIHLEQKDKNENSQILTPVTRGIQELL
jgi:hypothetical protein